MPKTAQAIDKFVTLDSIQTYAGAMLIVWVLYTTFRILFKRSNPIVLLVICQVVAFGGAIAASSLATPLQGLIVFVNGCLLFCTTLGANDAIVSAATLRPATSPTKFGKTPQRVFGLWLGR